MKPRYELRRMSPYTPPYGEISEIHGPAVARPAARRAAVAWGSMPEASVAVLFLARDTWFFLLKLFHSSRAVPLAGLKRTRGNIVK